MTRASIGCVLNNSNLSRCAKRPITFASKLRTFKRRLAGLRDMVVNLHNRISKLEADRKATETELKAKLWSAQLAAKENISSLLAHVLNGSKNETAKAKRLDSTKSLAKAFKTGSGSEKKLKALELPSGRPL
jgi:CII-binding regulator of phage lambda lysogenization HflD